MMIHLDEHKRFGRLKLKARRANCQAVTITETNIMTWYRRSSLFPEQVQTGDNRLPEIQMTASISHPRYELFTNPGLCAPYLFKLRPGRLNIYRDNIYKCESETVKSGKWTPYLEDCLRRPSPASHTVYFAVYPCSYHNSNNSSTFNVYDRTAA